MSAYLSHRSAPTRVFDHLYDPLYTTSGSRDVMRADYRCLAASAVVGIYPVHRTMFTDSPYRPRNYYVPARNPLPYLNRATATQPNDNDNGNRSPNDVVANGADRAKFFANPISNTATVLLRLQLDSDCACIPPPSPHVEPHRNIGCQTRYRVQSAQTTTWMPDGRIDERCTELPELVHVAELLRDDTGGELPGVTEAELVARARKRRAWEKSLAPIASADDWQRRRVVLEAFEWEEWVGRENRIEYCQRLRLALVQRLMHERQQRQRTACGDRVEALRQRLDAERAKRLAQLQTKHRRLQRRLSDQHKQLQKKYAPVDVITEHIDRSSSLYAPQSRFGTNPKHRSFVPSTTLYRPQLDGYKVADVVAMPPASKPRKTANEELRDLYESLRSLRGDRDDHRGIPQCLTFNEIVSTEKADTPKQSFESLVYENENQMSVFMQKILKGRSIQKKLYASRNRYRELIAEFQSSHQLTDIRNMIRHSDRPNALTEDRRTAHLQQMRLAALMRAESQVQEITDQAISMTISFSLDLLDGEMVRLLDQQKAQALCMLAETERYKREAVEAGQRQHGDLRRRFHEEVARSLSTSRQSTVCEYLENVLVECLDKFAEKDARQKIRNTVQRIDREAGDPSPATLVADVLDRFVMPDVMRRIAHDNYLADVHTALFGEHVPDLLEEQRQQRLMKFIQSSVAAGSETTPATARSDSVLSDMDVGEDPAHHEAMRCIRHTLARAMQQHDANGAMKVQIDSILDDVLRSVVPENEENGSVTARSQNQEILLDIVTDVNRELWDMANQQNENGDELQGAMDTKSQPEEVARPSNENKTETNIEDTSSNKSDKPSKNIEENESEGFIVETTAEIETTMQKGIQSDPNEVSKSVATQPIVSDLDKTTPERNDSEDVIEENILKQIESELSLTQIFQMSENDIYEPNNSDTSSSNSSV